MVNSRSPLAYALAVCAVCIPLESQTTATIDIDAKSTIPIHPNLSGINDDVEFSAEYWRFLSPASVSGVTINIGGITASADYAGLVAAAESQVNFRVPQQFATLPEANYAIAISVNGLSSPSAVSGDPAVQLVIPIQH